MGAIVTIILWISVELLGLIHSVALVNRISMLTLAITFIAGWRADVPTPKEDKNGTGT